MKKVIVIALFLMLTGCAQEQPSYLKGSNKYATATAFDHMAIRYIKDERTGICFAERGIANDYSFTTVDCEKVKNFIGK